MQHGFRLRHHADQLDAQDFLDVGQRQHFAAMHALGVVAGDQQVFLDRVAAFAGALGLGCQDAQDAVRIAHRRHFRVGHDQRLVSEVHRHQRARLDAGGRVADDEFEIHLDQAVDDLLDAVARERILVARLRGRQDEQVLALLVLDQRLAQVGFALHHVDQVVHHAALATHDQVKVAQADVEVDHGSLVAAQGQAGGKAGAGGGLADASLAGGHNDDFCHGSLVQ
ncbi:hypothetical protein AU476_35015 [Cupriavidus sp. UYMSc13B]|nr:hypothetical protein AU476_35015 [Cupriavidus sp. UYMSc13B]